MRYNKAIDLNKERVDRVLQSIANARKEVVNYIETTKIIAMDGIDYRNHLLHRECENLYTTLMGVVESAND